MSNRKAPPSLAKRPSLDGAKTEELDLETRIPIKSVEDIVSARQKGRVIAQEIGFSMTQATLIATVISELARNIVLYAETGEITLAKVQRNSMVGFSLEAADEGPGIPNVEHAMMSGYSSSGGLGLGLPGVSQLVDEFDIQSDPGEGTRVSVIMWLR